MARHKLTEPLSFFPPPLPFVLTSSSHITDRFLSRVDEKLRCCFFSFFVCFLYVSVQRSKTEESQLSLSQLPLLDSWWEKWTHWKNAVWTCVSCCMFTSVRFVQPLLKYCTNPRYFYLVPSQRQILFYPFLVKLQLFIPFLSNEARPSLSNRSERFF